jgi:tripartite-type tricarboxylate transporter receptor subunit TctC
MAQVLWQPEATPMSSDGAWAMTAKGRAATPATWVIAAVVSVSAAISSPTSAQEFWAGKSLTVIIGTDTGGGYDVYGRAVGRHIVKYLPGKPTFIGQNVIGAGGKRAAEHIALIAPKDGTTIAILYPGAMVDGLTLERSKWRYDPTKLEQLGTADSGTRLCSTKLESKVKTFEQARQHETIIGASSPGGSTFDYPTMLNALTGTKFKVVSGYKAAADIAIAFDRGEVDGWCGVDYNTYMSVRPDWLRQKQVNTIVQLGLEPNPEMTSLGIPSIWQFVPLENRKAMELIVGQQMFQRPFVAPPGTPADRVKALQGAFMATMKDKEFLAEAAKMRLTVEPRSGPDVAKIVASMYASPPEVIAQMAKAIKPQ